MPVSLEDCQAMLNAADEFIETDCPCANGGSCDPWIDLDAKELKAILDNDFE